MKFIIQPDNNSSRLFPSDCLEDRFAFCMYYDGVCT
jgi:hypothetical protein